MPTGPRTAVPGIPRTPGESESPDTGTAKLERFDPAAWTAWWRFNRDAYIDLKSLLAALDPATGVEGQQRHGLSLELVRGRVVPALQAAVQDPGTCERLRAALIALARVEASCGEQDGITVLHAAPQLVAADSREGAEAAIVALGVRADPSAIALLCDLLADNEAGRLLSRGEPVDYRKRSLAAYSLGLIGEHATEAAQRGRIVRALIENLRANPSEPYDIQLAALIALGLVGLENCPDAADAPTNPDHFCRGTQLSFLLEFLQDPARHPRLRAQAVIPLARLTLGATNANMQAIREALLAPLEPRSKEADEVQQSCIVALGLLGDCDQDALDRDIRKVLARAAERGDRLARCLALVALARVGGRAGAGTDPGQGRAEIEALLVKHVRGGKGATRSWAALSLGVLARALAVDGGTLSPSTLEALRSTLAVAKSPEEVGALCIGLGLARDVGAAGLMLARAESDRDASARAYAALSLGLAGATDAAERLERLLAKSEADGELPSSIGTALRLLGRRGVVDTLAANESGPAENRAHTAQLLGTIGDGRAVDPLIRWLADKGQDETVRARAAWALGELCDPREHPWSTSIATDIHHELLASTLLSYGRDGSGLLEMR